MSKKPFPQNERDKWVVPHCLNKRVLDVGCVGDFKGNETSTRLHIQIKQVAAHVIGVDIDKPGIIALKRQGEEAYCANAEKFVAHPRVDVVVICSSLAHMDNPGMAIDCARKSLKDGGKLVISTANARYFGVFWNGHVGSGHKFLFAPDCLKRMLESHGFKVVEFKYFKRICDSNIRGWLYDRLLLRLRPQNSLHFGVVAQKVKR